MVSYQTSADDVAAAANGSAPPPHQPAASPWPDEQAGDVWRDTPPNRNDTHEANQLSNVPGSLVPGGSQRPAPANQEPADDDNAWVDAGSQPQQENHVDRVPSILRPGGGKNNNSNPFRNREPQSSSAAAPEPPTDDFAKVNIGAATNNPWSSAMQAQKTGTGTGSDGEHKSPPIIPSNMDNDPWSAPEAVIVQPPTPLNVPPQPEEQSAWTTGEKQAESKMDTAPMSSPMSDKLFEAFDEQERGVWDDLGSPSKQPAKQAEDSDDHDDWNMIDSETSSIASGKAGKAASKPVEQPAAQENPAQNLMDEPAFEPASAAAISTTNTTTTEEPAKEQNKESQGKEPEANAQPFFTDAEPTQADEKPALPARPVEQPVEQERWAPTREPVDGKAETYQIKNIRWHDPSWDKNPRTSPILMQNENGPCPLVALVNALSLTTPPDLEDTTLVQVLRSRERVSLNLVLDAVFDELMSPRRTSSEDALPDITELYQFLQSLHTGMNVNPRYIPTEQMIKAYKRSSLTHLHPTEREALMPGTFENSLEMRLYATFSIPLIHGWLPSKSDPAYAAFERQAASYEDVQNLLFREEELEAKLSDPGGGLSGPEQQLYQDIMTIKMFMNASATQLTQFGIDVISKAIRPGTFAIFFRNDHFSTLYCHPRTLQLLTLVTDAGYSSHDEVIWESLVDVNGERTELYSGDFRVVSGSGLAGPSTSSAYPGDQGGGWTTVQGRRGKDREQTPDLERPLSANHEQEDRDLALALQLQEEEEQKQRDEQERRNRESRLSEQYIEQQGRRPEPVNRGPRRASAGSGAQIAPARQSSNSVHVEVAQSPRRTSEQRTSPRPQAQQQQQIRPLIPPRRQPVSRTTETGEDAPPPSYEQAAHDRRVNPTTGRPNAGAAPTRPGGQMNPGNNSGYRRANQVIQPPVGSSGSYSRDRDRDCIVM